MKKKLFSILCAGLMLTACGQQNKNETTMDFTDDVQKMKQLWILQMMFKWHSPTAGASI